MKVSANSAVTTNEICFSQHQDINKVKIKFKHHSTIKERVTKVSFAVYRH